MSLDWNAEGVKDHDKLNHKITEGLVWATMAVDIGRITETNTKEFYKRLKMWGVAIQSDMGIKYSDVVDHIGLYTNVSKTTDNQFRKKIAKVIYDNVNWEFIQESREEKECTTK